jgi:thiaminase
MWIPNTMSYWHAWYWIFKEAGEVPIPTYVKYQACYNGKNYSQMTEMAGENLGI